MYNFRPTSHYIPEMLQDRNR